MTQHLIDKLSFNLASKLPMILQSEHSECGLACMAMISSYYGYETNLVAMRQKYPYSRGMTGAHLASLAEHLKMNYRGLRLDLEELVDLKTPCILHWGLDHFVVLAKATPEKIVIHDPAVGVRTVSMSETSNYFSGYAIEFSPRADFVKAEEKPTVSLRDFWKSLKGIKRNLVLLFSVTMVMQLWALLNPLLMRFIVDDVIIYRDTSLLTTLCLGFGLLVLLSSATSIIRSMFLMYLTKTLSLQIQNALFGKLIRLPLDYFLKRQSGDIMSRFGSLQSIQSLVTTTFVESFLDGIMVIFSLTMMIIYAPQLSVVTIVALSLYILLRLMTTERFKQLNEEMLVASGQERSSFVETLHSIQPIKLFGHEHHRQQIWQNKLAHAFNISIKTEQFSMLYSLVNKLIFSLENIIILYGCTQMIIQPRAIFSLGMMYAFLQYKGQFTSAVSSLVDNFFQLKMVKLHLERIADIALESSDRCFDENQYKKVSGQIVGSIDVKNLSFAYDAISEPVFSNLSFEVKTGESVAIIGPSGCGKSTLLKILVGLMDSQDGVISIDGVALKDRNILNYRQQIATVMQNDLLLSGSIRDNISFFDEQVDEEHLISCAKMASIHHDIMGMPMGYSTLVGELGSQLSGGQQQRILLARALYKKPRILFLDEATSHLDVATERVVSSGIKQLNITRVIIAHRPETIKTADRVLLMNNGQLVDVTHLQQQGPIKPEKKEEPIVEEEDNMN